MMGINCIAQIIVKVKVYILLMGIKNVKVIVLILVIKSIIMILLIMSVLIAVKEEIMDFRTKFQLLLNLV